MIEYGARGSTAWRLMDRTRELKLQGTDSRQVRDNSRDGYPGRIISILDR